MGENVIIKFIVLDNEYILVEKMDGQVRWCKFVVYYFQGRYRRIIKFEVYRVNFMFQRYIVDFVFKKNFCFWYIMLQFIEKQRGDR